MPSPQPSRCRRVGAIRAWRIVGRLGWVVTLTLLALLPSLPAPAWEDGSRLSRDELARRLVADPDTVKQLGLYHIVSQRRPADNDLIVPWEKENADRLQPMFLYDLADRLFPEDPDAALEWYAIAFVRSHYDAERCSEPVTDNVNSFSQHAYHVLEHITSHPQALSDAMARVLRRPDLLVDDISPLWICKGGVVGALGLPTGRVAGVDTAVKPAAAWPQLRQQAWEDAASRATGEQFSGPPRLGRIIKRLTLPRGASAVAWSPDGTMVATVGGLQQQIMLWEARTGKLLWERSGYFGGIQTLAFSNDGKLLMVSGAGSATENEDTALTLWSVASGNVAGQVRGPFPGQGAMANSARAIAVDRHSQLMAVVAFQDVGRAVAIYDMRAWSLVGKVVVERDIPQTVAFGSDGTLAVGTVGGTIALFDTQTRQLKRSITAHFVYSLAISPDATNVAGGIGDKTEPIRIWRTVDGALVRSYSAFGIFSEVDGLAWSPDGRYLASASFLGVRIWSADVAGPPLVSIDLETSAVAFSPDGALLAAAGNGGAIIVQMSSLEAAK
jgi:hypothetical protein